MENETKRRDFLKQLAAVTGGVVLAPWAVSACAPAVTYKRADGLGAAGPVKTPMAVPQVKPADWNAIDFNKKRGIAGAVPKSYLADITGPDGEKKHLGKHLPYLPSVDAKLIPAAHLAVMWGDPNKGYTQHPNAPKDDAKQYPGHWYNWVRVRRAVEGPTEEVQSTFVDWPGQGAEAKKFIGFGGADIRADSGKNTVYLVKLPKDAKPGDTLRVWGHCLTHGEFVDFIAI